ncbi:hypothetical protein BC792_12727 [Sphingobacterium allocomposti]|uniref:Uncharacterized protein n=1 Tax=Sphingobacterium allocomposti TaxID=415956 RepID=A0A5S5D2P7_9SPHI|nr:hypothetical protein BC792_12727 [Sphingobacterium composti Yoo et al. 2007 non Ten et al. 2007]
MSQGYAKKREREIEDIKFIAWHSMVGTRLEKIPSFEQFVLGKKSVTKASQSQRDKFISEAMKHYNSKKNRI